MAGPPTQRTPHGDSGSAPAMTQIIDSATPSRYKSSQVNTPSIDVTVEILINVTPRETRVAVVENGMLQEVHVERALRRGYVGNVYTGRISRVKPGMQATFNALGL